MVVSNPNSIPGGLKAVEANYGNGWSCVDIAAEIIKGIQKQHSNIDDARLRAMIVDNLRICTVRHDKSSSYEDGKTIGLHSKHFIVDDKCCYIGSQNLYMCDLAEWGIVVDSEEEVKKIMNDYFVPLWKNSYTGEDVDVEQVMDGLNVDRDGEQTMFSGFQSAEAAQQLMPHGAGAEYYDFEKDKNVETDETKPPAAANEDDGIPDEETGQADRAKPDGEDSPTARDRNDVDQDSSEKSVSTVPPPPETVSSDAPMNDEAAINSDPPKETAVPEGTPERETPQKKEATPQKAVETEDTTENQGIELDFCGIIESFKIASE
mmetsp:Transcript_6969/g.15907  ORF Transcript_6969/g.15907 Transcript_6969/m.15907 type:complete len:320 (+) Transcript_6969:1312-2271(+)